MINRIAILLTALIVLFIYSCTNETENTPVEPEYEIDPIEKGSDLSASTGVPDITQYRVNYSHVVRDDDGWEVMLNLRKRRKIAYKTDSLWSYKGHLIYRLSYYVIKGKATAMYDPRYRSLVVCALDSAWNRGNIIFDLYCPPHDWSGSDEWEYLDGTYHYYKFPHRMNKISARIVKGYFGYKHRAN